MFTRHYYNRRKKQSAKQRKSGYLVPLLQENIRGFNKIYKLEKGITKAKEINTEKSGVTNHRIRNSQISIEFDCHILNDSCKDVSRGYKPQKIVIQTRYAS